MPAVLSIERKLHYLFSLSISLWLSAKLCHGYRQFFPQDSLHVTICSTSPVNVTYTPTSRSTYPANKMVSPMTIWFVSKLCFEIFGETWRIFVFFWVSSSNELGLGLVITGIFSAAISDYSSFLKITSFNIRFDPPSQNPVFCSCICSHRLQVQSCDNGICTLSESQ